MRSGSGWPLKFSFYMSHGNMLLGQARGKVGDLVFSRSGGKQIVRSRAAQVKNPQTEKQMIQRIILATVAQAYSRMSEICDHSFEGVPSGQRSASYFNRVNMDRLRQAIAREIANGGDLSSVYAFTPISSQVYAANEFLISRGSLPSVEVAFSGSVAATLALADNTYQGVLDAYGLQRGDQLTFVTTQGTTGENTQFVFARVILDPTNADGSAAPLASPFIADGAVNLPNPRNEGVFSTLSFAAGSVSYAFSAQPISGAAVIVSRQKSDGSWLRSTAVLAVNDVAIAGFMQSMQDCLDLFASGSIDALSEKYLNNAGRGRVAQSGAGLTLGLGSVVQGADGKEMSFGADDSVVVVAAGTKVVDGKTIITLFDAAGNEHVLMGSSAYNYQYKKTILQGADGRQTNSSAPTVADLEVGQKLVSPWAPGSDGENSVNAGTLGLQSFGVPLAVWVNP